jgi:hypothetical protein
MMAVLGFLWALPCSAVGAVLALVVMALGGSARRAGHTLEVALAVDHAAVPRWARGLGYSAITFGHVIVGQSHEALAELRIHERVHVRQYEVLGPLFFVAYPLSSLLAWLPGRCPYRGNWFERQAVRVVADAQRSAASSAPACGPKA